MSARRILIVYGTKYGHTARVARRIADVLTSGGDAVTIVNGDELPRRLSPAAFDGVVVGASVIRNRHQRCIRRFVRHHRALLNVMPSAFFSVSGAAAGPAPAEQAKGRRYLDEFLRSAHWSPMLTESVAGTMAYTSYSPIMRWIIRRVASRAGGPTDTSRDHDFTDWVQVERFAGAFAATLPDHSNVLATNR